MLVRDGRVLALGPTAELRKRAGAEARVVDAGRRMVVSSKPGGRINQGDPADLVLVDDLVWLVPPPELCPARLKRRSERVQQRRRTPSLVGYITQQVVYAPGCLYDFGRTGAEDIDDHDYVPLPMPCLLRALL